MTRHENSTEQDYAQSLGETKTRKEYQSPRLHVYGTITALTAGNVDPKTGMDNPGNLKTG